MLTPDQLAELHVKEHDARLKHIDELPDTKQAQENPEDYVKGLKQKSPQEFMDKAGPMVMWEIIAQKLEKFFERIKKAS